VTKIGMLLTYSNPYDGIPNDGIPSRDLAFICTPCKEVNRITPPEWPVHVEQLKGFSVSCCQCLKVFGLGSNLNLSDLAKKPDVQYFLLRSHFGIAEPLMSEDK